MRGRLRIGFWVRREGIRTGLLSLQSSQLIVEFYNAAEKFEAFAALYNDYGFWMYKTVNNPRNGNQDNKQTFRGGDGFCQGKKGSLPHLYNADIVRAAEDEVKSKLGESCLGTFSNSKIVLYPNFYRSVFTWIPGHFLVCIELELRGAAVAQAQAQPPGKWEWERQ